MGQYHKTVNLTKKEFLHPHKLGCGLKLWEQLGHGAPGGVSDALTLLLAVSSGRGGGDFPVSKWVGRWGGDHIAIIGDYADKGDLREYDAPAVYAACSEGDNGEPPEYRDISDELIPLLEEAFEVIYFGEGWRGRERLCDVFAGWEYSHSRGDHRVARISSVDVPVRILREHAKSVLTDKYGGRDMLPIPVPESILKAAGA